MLAKLCACSGALIAEMPYAAMVPRGGSNARGPRRTGGTGGGGGGQGGRAGVEESLGDLLRALARLMMDVAAEPSARIAGACFAAVTARLGCARIDPFLCHFYFSVLAATPIRRFAACVPTTAHGR